MAYYVRFVRTTTTDCTVRQLRGELAVTGTTNTQSHLANSFGVPR